MGILEAVYRSSSNRSPERLVWAGKPRRDHRKSVYDILRGGSRIGDPGRQRMRAEGGGLFNETIRAKPMGHQARHPRRGHYLTRGHEPAPASHTLGRVLFHWAGEGVLVPTSWRSAYSRRASRAISEVDLSFNFPIRSSRFRRLGGTLKPMLASCLIRIVRQWITKDSRPCKQILKKSCCVGLPLYYNVRQSRDKPLKTLKKTQSRKIKNECLHCQ